MKSGKSGKKLAKVVRLRFISLTIFLLVVLSYGCYESVTLKTIPPNSDVQHNIPLTRLAPVAYLKSIQFELNGVSSRVNPSFEQKFIGRLQESGLFEDVVGLTGTLGNISIAENEKRKEENRYDLFLNITIDNDYDRVGNGIKGLFIGLSLFVLAPVLPMDYDIDETMTLTVRKFGEEKKYSATAKASAIYTMNHQRTAPSKANSDVDAKCITSILNQLSADIGHR